jgi:hypothetical protein
MILKQEDSLKNEVSRLIEATQKVEKQKVKAV